LDIFVFQFGTPFEITTAMNTLFAEVGKTKIVRFSDKERKGE